MHPRNIRISNLEDHRGHRAVCFGVATREGPQSNEIGTIDAGRKRDVEIVPGQLLVIGSREDIDMLFTPPEAPPTTNEKWECRGAPHCYTPDLAPCDQCSAVENGPDVPGSARFDRDAYENKIGAIPNIAGASAQTGTAETDADPDNPNVEQPEDLTGMDWGKPDAQG